MALFPTVSLGRVLLLLIPATAFAQSPLNIQIVEGQGAINNITRKVARAPIVLVADANQQPVAGATVTFTLPGAGPGGTFEGSGRNLTVTTGGDGRATGRGLVPNNIPGPFEIRVAAAQGGRTVQAIITQTNAAPAVRSSGRSRGLIILGLVAGGVGGVLAATMGGSSSPSPPQQAPRPTPGTITPGAPGFGPPQ